MYIRVWGGGGFMGRKRGVERGHWKFTCICWGVKTKLSMKARKTTSHPPPLLIKNERFLREYNIMINACILKAHSHSEVNLSFSPVSLRF
jgi:hypothetical protein